MKQITHVQPPSWIGNEYSSICPFNADNSRLLLVAHDHFALHDGDGGFIKDLAIAASSEPRWDREDPGRLYYVSGNTLRLLDVETGTSHLLRTFAEYRQLSGRGESDISADGKHLVLEGDRQAVFIYNLETETQSPVLRMETAGLFDNLYISANNEAVIGWYAKGPGRQQGIEIYSPGMQIEHQLTTTMGHCAVTRYQGRNVLLWCSSNDPAINRNAVVMVDMIDPTVKTVLMELDWRLAFHISTCDQPWCLVSTYAPDNSLPMQLWKVPFDGSGPTLICNTGGVYRDYTSQPKAALSRDGSRAVFSVDDGQAVNAWMVRFTDDAVKEAKQSWQNIGSLPYDENTDMVHFNSAAKSVTVYRRAA